MTNIALIRDGVVANVIVGSLEFAQSLGFDAAVETDSAGIGWAWDGSEFTAPVPEHSEPSLDDLVTQTKSMISAWLDSVVQAKGYDSIVSCASYANSTDPTFRAEAQAAIAWRDAVYRRGYEILADIPDGVTTPEQVIALLPQPAEYGWAA